MLQYKSNPRNGINIKCPGFDIDIVTHANLHTSIDEHAVHVSPNISFNTDTMPKGDIHVLFAVDTSTSMNQGLSSENCYESKINITKNSLIETLEFLYALVVKGRRVFISLVTFSSESNIMYNRAQLTSVKDMEDMCATISNIYACGSTNLGSAIIDICDISKAAKKDDIYKILISDGYVNTGVVGVPQLKYDYANYFNASIGLGSENDYDKVLLQTLSNEDSERSCFDSSEMKDQIVDSVFANINKIADNVSVESRNIVGTIINKDVSEDSAYTTINKDIGFNSKCMFLLRQGKSKIRINGVQRSYLMSSDCNITNPITFSCDDNKTGKITVTISPMKGSSAYMPITSELNNRVTIEIELHLTTNKGFTSNNMCKSFRHTQSFIDINNTLMSLNLEKPKNCDKTDLEEKIIKKELRKVNILNKKIIALLKSIKQRESSEWNDYMITVLGKFKSSIVPYIGEFGFTYITNNVGVYTPLRMSRSQSSRGSYAFSGRQASMGFSQSVVNELSPGDNIDDVSVKWAQPVEQSLEQPVEQPVEQSLEQPVEQPLEQPVEQPLEQPLEQPVEQPLAKPVLKWAQSTQGDTVNGIQVNRIPGLYPGANCPTNSNITLACSSPPSIPTKLSPTSWSSVPTRPSPRMLNSFTLGGSFGQRAPMPFSGEKPSLYPGAIWDEPPSLSLPERSILYVGESVRVNRNNMGSYYPGQISVVAEDGSYSVLYNDGEKEDHVQRDNISTWV